MQGHEDSKTGTILPQISIIAAMTSDRVIGDGHGLPWHLPDELRLFKNKTLGATVIMGRKTYESIGHPLPGRHNIVLSRSLHNLPGMQVCTSLITSLISAAQHNQPVFIIGGAELYRKALPVTTELHISWIKKEVSGDIYFPEIDFTEWTIRDKEDHTGFRYVRYRRKRLAATTRHFR